MQQALKAIYVISAKHEQNWKYVERHQLLNPVSLALVVRLDAQTFAGFRIGVAVPMSQTSTTREARLKSLASPLAT